MKHHRWMTILGIVAMLWLIYVLNIRGSDQVFFRFREFLFPAESVAPLIRLDDPRYAHERETRIQYIYDQLDTLKDVAGAQRIYVFSYSSPDSMSECISNVFEVVSSEQTSQFHTLQGLPINTAYDMKDTIYERNGLNPFRYSAELYDDNEMLIGSFGIEFTKNIHLLQERQLLNRIRQTMRNIEAALSQSIEYVEVRN
jgi:hypothetical protein